MDQLEVLVFAYVSTCFAILKLCMCSSLQDYKSQHAPLYHCVLSGALGLRQCISCCMFVWDSHLWQFLGFITHFIVLFSTSAVDCLQYLCTK